MDTQFSFMRVSAPHFPMEPQMAMMNYPQRCHENRLEVQFSWHFHFALEAEFPDNRLDIYPLESRAAVEVEFSQLV